LEKEIFIIDENYENHDENNSPGKFDELLKKFVPRKKVLLSDTVIDMKVISVPVVSNNLLSDIILNSIKRLTATIPVKDDIDYLILEKNNSKYEILVFIKHDINNIDLSGFKVLSIYQVLENLMMNDGFPENTSFVVMEKNVFFVYNFKDRIFRKRSIYFENDIESLKNQGLFLISIKNHRSIDGFNIVGPEKVDKAITSCKKEIFCPNKNKKTALYMVIAAIAAVFFVIFLEISLFNQNKNIEYMNVEIVNNELSLKKMKENRGISEDSFKKYQNLLTNKSYVNALFDLLYFYGKNNIMIQGLSCNGRKFSMTGTCLSDAKIEKALRTSSYFKNVSFYFLRNNGEIHFRIEGEINYEL
jgi:hypothetical protein